MTFRAIPPKKPARRRLTKAIIAHLPDYKDIHAIADKLAPGLSDDFIAAVKSARTRIGADVWERMLLDGKPNQDKLDDLVSVLADTLRPSLERDYRTTLRSAGQTCLDAITAAPRQAAEVADDAAGAGAGGIATTTLLDDKVIPGVFDLNDANAIAFVSQHAGDLIVEVSDDVRQAVRAIVTASFEGEYDVRTTAKLLPSIVGLTERQAQAVTSFYAGMLKSEDHTTETAGQLADDYATRLLKQRAMTIARTETIRGANAGVDMGFRQAQSSGLLDEGAMKTWITTPDDALCDECADLDGEEVDLEDVFSSGDDAPPLHPNCRCAVGISRA